MNQSETLNELITALSKAQGMMKPAVFNKINPHFRNRYADFTAVMDACRQPLSENGLSVMQYTETVNDQLKLVTLIAHMSGQFIKSYFPLNPAKMDSQSIGSSLTYAKRYCLSAMLGIVSDDDDDDAEGSMGRGQQPQQKPKEQPSYQKKSPAQVAAESPELSEKKLITEEEGKELGKLMAQCDQEYQDSVWKFLTEAKVSCYEEMTPTLYGKIKQRTLDKINGK